MGTAFAQAPVAVELPKGGPSQGQVAYPLVNPTAYVNTNNNYQAAMLPGALANPMPGTIVIHINGKIQTEVAGQWTSADSRFNGTPGSTAANTGEVKVQPVSLNEY